MLATNDTSYCTLGDLTAKCRPDVTEPGRSMLWDCARVRVALNMKRTMCVFCKSNLSGLPQRWPEDAMCVDFKSERVTSRRLDATVTTGGLVALLLEQLQQVQTPKETRPAAYKLLTQLVTTACSSAATGDVGCTVIKVVLHSTLDLNIIVHSTERLGGLEALFATHTPLWCLWRNHVGQTVLGDETDIIRIKSSPDAPQCMDLILVLLMTSMIYAEWYNLVGRPLLIAIAQKITGLLEKRLWQGLLVGAKQSLPAPVKTGAKGLRVRKIEPAKYRNALNDLKNGTKLADLELHPVHRNLLVRAMCFAHMESTTNAFALHSQQWSFAWDPGLHSTQDTLVLTGLCASINKIAYGPAINLRKVHEGCMKPHDDVLSHLEKGRNLVRQAALYELIGLDLSLHRGFGISLTQFAPPANSLLRPLTLGERRVVLDNAQQDAHHDAQHSPLRKRFGIADAEGKLLGPELPLDAQNSPSLAWCTHWADQGSVGAAGINFLTYDQGYRMILFPDPNHRTWNDIKLALRRSKGFFYRTLVMMTLVFNLNYSPFLKGSFFDKKKEFFADWATTATIEDPLFRKHAQGIAKDHGLPPPQTEDDWNRLLAKVKDMKNCQNKGPLVKMMRRGQLTEKHTRVAQQNVT